VTRPEFSPYGTCPPGLAESSHSVPLNALTTALALSVVIVTTVPAGDVNVTSRSLL
jgi:hypothetical protein